MAKVIPNVESIPTAAIPTPYNPMDILAKLNSAANRNESIIPATIVSTGMAVEIIPVPIPFIITVAGPVSELLAISCVGL